MNWLGSRAVVRPENSEGGHNLSLLVEIGFTDLPKSGGAPHMAPPSPTGLGSITVLFDQEIPNDRKTNCVVGREMRNMSTKSICI